MMQRSSNVKTILTTSFFSLLAMGAVVYTSCNKPKYDYVNKCEGISCQNGGVCIDGACSCSGGYYGDRCQNKSTKRYLGRWLISQEVLASGHPASIGQKKTYEVNITENPDGVTLLNVQGFLGNAAYSATWRVSMMPGTVAIDSTKVETEVAGPPTSFVLKQYQPLGSAGVQVLKGSGSINEIATHMTGEVYITMPDTAKGIIQERISFTGEYIN